MACGGFYGPGLPTSRWLPLLSASEAGKCVPSSTSLTDLRSITFSISSAALSTHLDYKSGGLLASTQPSSLSHRTARKALFKNVNQIVGVFVFLFIAFPIILKNKSI